MKRIFIFDTDYCFSKKISEWLGKDGYDVRFSDDIRISKSHIGSGHFDILVIGIRYRECNGMKLINWINQFCIGIPFVFALDRDDNVLTAMAFKYGALDYIDKRTIVSSSFLQVITNVYTQLCPHLKDYSYRSEVYLKCLRIAEIASTKDDAVLIMGESGSGKSHIAKRIHSFSNRPAHLFTQIRCALLNETNSLEQLLGVERHGDMKSSSGILSNAGRGTLLFDEVDKLPPNAQLLLAHLLEEGKYHAIGSNIQRSFNARVVVSTSRNLNTLVAKGRFRRDLYDLIRHNVINVPSLRSCKEDIIPLAEYFLSLNTTKGIKCVKGFSASAMQHILSYSWTGNIRELRSVVNQAYAECDTPLIKSKHLHFFNTEACASPYEERSVMEALSATGNNKTLASKMLGISRPTLYAMMRRNGI